jgi:predicted MFS family arabinose efflux permease
MKVADPSRAQRGMMMNLVVIGLTSFFTLIDLFGAQAVLPALSAAYGATPAAMGSAVNASTFGMAVAGLGVALFARRIDRRTGIWVSLALLAIPTALLAFAGDLATFTALRVAQGLFMSAAFTLTMAYLAEECTAAEAASAMAAYITGNVASNLFGRLLAAAFADGIGLPGSFLAFAVLNLVGAAVVYVCLGGSTPRLATGPVPSPLTVWATHLSNRALQASFAIGFLILFAFIGTFTYVNYVLAAPPLSLPVTLLGVVYLVFVPSMLTTPFAGRVAERLGRRSAFLAGLAVAGVGLALLAAPSLWLVLTGLAMVGAGTFFAQAVTTGFVGRAATLDRAAASGLYLASYYLGGLAGSLVLGAVFDAAGWTATVAAIFVALALAAMLGLRLVLPETATALAPAGAAKEAS